MRTGSGNNKIKSAIEFLNFYRNCHYSDPSGSESYLLANAINDILPLLSILEKSNATYVVMKDIPPDSTSIKP